MKRFILLFFLYPAFIIYPQSYSSLTISEVMFNPESGNNEFIEIYNTSTVESIDLKNIKIQYAGAKPDVIDDSFQNTILPPLSFAVIFQGNYDLLNGIYNSIVPTSALILKISDNSFGTSGMANNSDREIFLLSLLDDTLETYTYSADNNKAYSDEKINLNKDNSSSNWGNSIRYNGTPGFKNSLTPFSFDLELTRIKVLPLLPKVGENVTLNSVIKNTGIKTANNFSIEFYNDANKDSLVEANEIIKEESFTELKPGDSISAIVKLNSIEAGTYNIIVKINYSEDENISNNILFTSFVVKPPAAKYNDIVVNEIMYAPSHGEPEWVELFNQSSNSINIMNWRIYDNTSSTLITKDNILIKPNSFFIVSKDSSIKHYYNFNSPFVVINLPSLNNTGDAVVLKDSLDYLIDSLSYIPSWGGSNGKSLERVNSKIGSNISDNWGTSESIFNATPGKINSLTPKENNLKISLFKSLNNYGILGSEIKFFIQITNNGLAAADNFYVKLFRDKNADSVAQTNELLTTLTGNTLLPADSTLFTLSTEDFIEGINHFVARIEFTYDEDTTDNIAFLTVKCVKLNEERNDVIINEFMYAPDNGEPEWIELFNKSNKTINLKNYIIADAKDTVKVFDQDLIMNPKEYLILSADSTINKYFNVISTIQVHKFPSLNNGGDKIILIDSLSRTIDSLEFYSSWGGSKGRSIERINANKQSTDSLNWETSLSKYKATPGYINSVSPKEYDMELTGLSFSPVYPFFNDDVSIYAKIKNNGSKSSMFSIGLFEDTNNDSIPDIQVKELPNLSVPPYDSLLQNLQYTIKNISSRKSYYAEILFTNDQDTSNNYFYQSIIPSYKPGSILINEIMYNPSNGEPEWIELFNNSGESININSWSITDVVTTPVTSKIFTNVKIPSKEYLVITRDSSIVNYHKIIPSSIVKVNLPVLNNDYDGVVLKDERGVTIDSVLYNKEMGGTSGKSLERKSVNISSGVSSNWEPSEDFELSTPGRINSITGKKFDLAAEKLSFNPAFPVAGENVYLKLLVKNYGSSYANNFSVKFYVDSDSNNTTDKLIDTQSNLNLNSGDSLIITTSTPVTGLNTKLLAAAKIIFNGDENPYNNDAENFLETGYSNGLIKINEIMYSPLNGTAEWVEFVNTSSEKVNLMNWSLGDLLPNPTKNFISSTNFYVEPDEYFIIASDTSFYGKHTQLKSKIKIVNFGSLGNNGDGIVIYDFRNAVIDSFQYKSSWGGRNGFSLERFSLTAPPNDSSNWSTSLSPDHSTPGETNSIVNVPSYKRNDIVFNEIMFDPGKDNNEFIEFYNLSEKQINLGGWLLEEENGKTFKVSDTAILIPSKDYFILAADSSIISYYNLFNYPYKTIIGTSDLGLNNSDELLLLKDLRGNIIDSLRYFSDWHNKNFVSTKNISLERINPYLNCNDPSNWSSSANNLGATPGKQNSIFAEIQKSESKLSASPSPFSPDNDGFEDFTIISYNLTQSTSQVSIKIFDSRGRLVRNLVNNHPSGSKGSIIFNGLDDSGRALRIGIYIIFLEALSQSNAVLETMKTVVVVARKLH